MSRAQWGRWVARGALVLAALWLLLEVRCIAEANRELGLAQQAQAEERFDARVQALSRAVRWAAPFNLPADRALDQLLDLAEHQRRQGNPEAARATYRSLRGSLIASAGLWQPHAGQLAQVERELARLAPRAEGDGRAAPAPLSRAARRSAQHTPWARLLALCGFLSWVGAGFALASLGDRPAGRARWVCGAVLAAGLSCFGAGLWLS